MSPRTTCARRLSPRSAPDPTDLSGCCGRLRAHGALTSRVLRVTKPVLGASTGQGHHDRGRNASQDQRRRHGLHRVRHGDGAPALPDPSCAATGTSPRIWCRPPWPRCTSVGERYAERTCRRRTPGDPRQDVPVPSAHPTQCGDADRRPRGSTAGSRTSHPRCRSRARHRTRRCRRGAVSAFALTAH